MDKTLTIRLDREQDAALTERAAALGKTKSDLVRELIEKGLEEQPLARRIGHLKGRLQLPAPRAGWQRRIKDRNWR
jgi:hypothetical protein